MIQLPNGMNILKQDAMEWVAAQRAAADGLRAWALQHPRCAKATLAAADHYEKQATEVANQVSP